LQFAALGNGLLERVKIELRLQGPLKVSPKEQPPGERELRIPEILNSYPGHGAEQNHNHAGDAIVLRDALQKRKDGDKAANAVKDQSGFARRQPAVEQAVMDVAPVRGEDRLTPKQAAG